jgi:hypothetical protein
MSKMKIELIATIAAKLKSYGYTVYVSKDGRYGFYTDGRNVVSFGGQWQWSVNFNGNYKSQRCGTGWLLDGGKELSDIDQHTAECFIKAIAPSWATRGEAVTPTTPEQHLQMYGKSSGYTQV